MKQTLTFLKQKHLYLGIIRYLLGIWMLPYALSKILKLQFVLTGFAFTQMQTLESLSGKQLAWTFLGYSDWFQVLVGFLELIPAVLLLFRRTTLLGAILMLPITLNVFLINYAFQLWDGTKLVSSILLGLNLLVLALEWNRIKALLLIIVGKGLRIKFTSVEIAVNGIVISAVGYFLLPPLLGIEKQTNDLTGDWLSQHPVEWVLQKEQYNDSTLAYRKLKLYFDAYGRFNEVDDAKTTSTMSYTINTSKRKLNLKYSDENIVSCTYQLVGETGLKIERMIDTAKHVKVIQYYEKRVINEDRKSF